MEIEAVKKNMIAVSTLPYLFGEYKQILKDLYEIFVKKKEIVCSGFTLQELETLIPWSSERMEDRDLKMNLGVWLMWELERDPNLKTSLLKVNKQVEKLFEASGSSFPDKGEWGKLDWTWSECKEILQKLSIIKFEEAAGFECSQNLMDLSLIHI